MSSNNNPPGFNRFTEAYSALEAEVVDARDPFTGINLELVQEFSQPGTEVFIYLLL